MIFRQLYDHQSSTYTYLLASRMGGEAVIIDPVITNTAQYVELIKQLGLKLVMSIDTHIHADHITASGHLRMHTDCLYAMGEESRAECVSYLMKDNETLKLEDLKLTAIYTPGHTDDSYSFVMNDRVFSGDTLLIRGTGRTDFQNGDAGLQYDSLFQRLLTLPDETLVYPAHDYEGRTSSSILEEKLYNPRLQVKSREEYIAQMDALNLDPPQLIKQAVPANIGCGMVQAA